MLKLMTRKLCPLLSLAIATVGCGKKIVDSETQPGRTTENQELPSAYVIKLDGNKSSRENYYLGEAAQFNLPDRLRVLQGNTLGKVVEIAYDVNEYDSEDYFYKCSYKAAPNPNEMILDKCVDYDGDDLGDLDVILANKFTLNKNDIIQMRFAGAPAADMSVEAVYSMTWVYPQ